MVHLGPFQSSLVYFGSNRSYSVHLNSFEPFGPRWPISVHFVIFRSFLSKSVQLGSSFVHFEFALEQIGFHVLNGFLSCNHRSLLYPFITFFRFLIFWITKKCYLIIMYMYYYIIVKFLCITKVNDQ